MLEQILKIIIIIAGVISLSASTKILRHNKEMHRKYRLTARKNKKTISDAPKKTTDTRKKSIEQVKIENNKDADNTDNKETKTILQNTNKELQR